MIATWMLYATLVALALGAAAWIFERATRDYRIPSRWIWAVALGASGVFPVAALIASRAADVLPAAATSEGSGAYSSPDPVVSFDVSGVADPIVIEERLRPALPKQ